MKKTFIVMIVITLIFTLCSCKKDDKNIDSGGSPSDSSLSTESNTSSKPLESTTSETASDNKSAVEQATTSSSTSSIPKEENKPKPRPNQNNNTVAEKYAYLTADTSRAPSTDVGSVISNGYIYYTNPRSDFPEGLFRKKISGGEEEILTERPVEGQKVLNETVYFMSYDNYQRNLYKCNPDGSNIKKIFDDVDDFEVAGNWIFAIRDISDTLLHAQIYHSTDELYAISTDGSVVKRIKPQESNNAGSEVTIFGFNRGYLYVRVHHMYFVEGDPYTLTYTSNELHLRIDYRSKDLVQKELKRMDNANYIYDGDKYYDYRFEKGNIVNDHIIQRNNSKAWAVSFLNITATTVREYNESYTTSYPLKDYYVNITSDFWGKTDKIVFVNYDSGEERVFNIDWCEYIGPDSQINHSSHHQDVTGNSLLLAFYVSKGTTDDFYLFMMDPNGQLTEIYKKTI